MTNRAELATAILDYIEAIYNPVHRHSALDYRSPIVYERQHTTTQNGCVNTQQKPSGEPGTGHTAVVHIPRLDLS